jgi:hypothetical protein
VDSSSLPTDVAVAIPFVAAAAVAVSHFDSICESIQLELEDHLPPANHVVVLAEKFAVVFDNSLVTVVTVSTFYNKSWTTSSIGHHQYHYGFDVVVAVAADWMTMLLISRVLTDWMITIAVADCDTVWIPNDYNHEPFSVSFHDECPGHPR